MNRFVPLAATLLVAACAEAPVATAPPPMRAATPVATRVEAPQPTARVHEAQQRLRTLGLYQGPIDGIWGPETQAAVERFQRDRGLNVTARLDDATTGALRGDAAPPRAAASAPIALSDATAVRTVQNRLRQLGHYRGPADGIWGTQTQVALERFQRSRGLPVGQVTEPTLSAMGLDPAAFATRAVPGAHLALGDPLEPGVVRGVQQRLRRLGFYPGRIDGRWGPATDEAIVRFQRSRGLEATGDLNPATASALGLDPNDLAGSAAARR